MWRCLTLCVMDGSAVTGDHEMKVKTSEAKDQVLEYLVSTCEGKPVLVIGGTVYDKWAIDEGCDGDNSLHYSTDWAQGGPIIEREKIGVWWATHYVDDEGQEYGNHWYAEMGCTDENADSPYCGVADGPTPLIAAMRCYVASKLGDEVEIPEELNAHI